SVEAHAGGVALLAAAAVSQPDGRHAVRHARDDLNRTPDAGGRDAQVDEVAVDHAQPPGGGRAEQGGVVPGELADGGRLLQQPGVVGESSVVHGGRGVEL